MTIRIQKYLSQQKIYSRREAEELIKRGLIKVNGKLATIGQAINPEKDEVEIIGQTNKKVTLAFYKPRGVISDQQKIDGQLLNTVGRLDKESEGLILLSNDGTVTAAVTSNKHTTEKEYEVTTQEKLSLSKIKKMETGIVLEDGPTLPAKIRPVSNRTFVIILKEGRNHQIRRMAAALHLTAIKIKRVRIGNVKLGSLKTEEYRLLTVDEISRLKGLNSNP